MKQGITATCSKCRTRSRNPLAIALWQAISGRRAAAAAFEGEVPVWPAETGYSLRRYVSGLARRLSRITPER